MRVSWTPLQLQRGQMKEACFVVQRWAFQMSQPWPHRRQIGCSGMSTATCSNLPYVVGKVVGVLADPSPPALAILQRVPRPPLRLVVRHLPPLS